MSKGRGFRSGFLRDGTEEVVFVVSECELLLEYIRGIFPEESSEEVMM